MPATEASVEADEQLLTSYELAFHVLPTVAEGEVATVFQNLKDIITKHSGTIDGEEAPARFDLAYEIIKYLEGRNRKFTSAYFGWVRFTAEKSAIAEITEEVEAVKELLRHLLVKLTKTEEENPFLFHDALDDGQEEDVEDKVEDKKTESKKASTEEVKEEAKEEVKEEVKEEKTEAKDGEEVVDKV